MGMFCPQAIKDNRTGGEVGGLFPCVVLGRLETRNPLLHPGGLNKISMTKFGSLASVP